jgi:SAM-dependent methyltransferase
VTTANTDQAEYWASLASVWVEIEDQLEEVSGLPGQMAMDRLPLQPGQRVLDLGCGTARTTLELARRVAPTGLAIGVDIAAEMLERARQHGADAEVDNVEFLHADVQSHDLGQGRYDAAYSRFGVMFFTDPVMAFTRVFKALRPGGWLSFVCWQPLAANEWMLVPCLAAASVTGKTPPVPSPDQPGPCSFSDPDRVRSILGSAGFARIDIQPHDDVVATSEDRIPELAVLAMKRGAIREMLKDTNEPTRIQVQAAVEAALRSKVEEGEVRARRGIILVTARVG